MHPDPNPDNLSNKITFLKRAPYDAMRIHYDDKMCY